MAMPQTASTRCQVRIVAPTGRSLTFRSEEANNDLLAVEVSKDLGSACGSFSLHLAPRLDRESRRWDQIIPRRSLVLISMERPGVPDLADASSLVMIGLTDDHGADEAYSEAHPRRRVLIHGRELSCVIVDAVLWFNMYLASNPSLGTLTLHTLEGERRVALTYNASMQTDGESPITILQRILDYYLFLGGKAVAPATTPNLQQPVISLDLPGVKLADVLDKNVAAWNTFEPTVRVLIIQLPIPGGSLWNYLNKFVDHAFQEFFTRVEDGVCKIHFRGKPFLQTDVASGTRFKTTADEPTLKTLRLDPADILAIQVRTQTANVLNVFLAGPKGLSDLWQDPTYRYRLIPAIIDDWRHPSFVGRYGLRVYEVESLYLSPQVDPRSNPGTGAPPTGAAPGPGVIPLKDAPAAAATYAPVAARIAKEQGLPPELIPWFLASIEQESGFNPIANGTSGEQGMAQLMPATQARFGVTQPYDYIQSLTGAVKYWNFLRAQPYIGNDPRLILAGYNAGEGAVQHAGGKVPPQAENHVRNTTARLPHYQGYGGPAAPTHTPLPGAPEPPPAPATPAPAPRVSPQVMEETVSTALRWSKILKAWYDMGGELFGGSLTVRGHPAWNIGHRLLTHDQRGEWEAYVEGIAHSYDMRTGQFLTRLQITRGWYLSAAIAQQLWAEGQTQVTGTSGGLQTPQVLAPGLFGTGPED